MVEETGMGFFDSRVSVSVGEGVSRSMIGETSDADVSKEEEEEGEGIKEEEVDVEEVSDGVVDVVVVVAVVDVVCGVSVLDVFIILALAMLRSCEVKE